MRHAESTRPDGKAKLITNDPLRIARVTELIPVAVYQGRTYTQLALVEAAAGEKVIVFDPDMVLTIRELGKRCRFQLSAFIPDVERLSAYFARILNYSST